MGRLDATVGDRSEKTMSHTGPPVVVTQVETEEPKPEPKPEQLKSERRPGRGTPAAVVGEFDLPCGYLDPDGVLHTDIELSELTGEEEDIILSNLPSARIMDKLLANCVTRIGTITRKTVIRDLARDLLSGDRVYAMIALRRLTHGDAYKWTTKCSECGEKSGQVLDLRDLEVQKMADPMVRVFDAMLPKSDLSVRWKAMNGHMEVQREKVLKKSKGDRGSVPILLRLEQLGGKPVNMPALKKLPMGDRQYLRSQFDKLEGGVDTDVDVNCASCLAEFKTTLDITQPSFFFPTEALE